MLSIWSDPDCCHLVVNSLPNQKILDWSKLKAFADNKIEELKMIILSLIGLNTIVGKEKKGGNQHFLLFPQCFQRVFPQGH